MDISVPMVVVDGGGVVFPITLAIILVVRGGAVGSCRAARS